MKNDTDKFSIILITGNSRSGTTLISEVLGTSERIKALPELHYFENLVDRKELDGGIDEADRPRIVRALVRRAFLGFFEAEQEQNCSDALLGIESRVLEATAGINDAVVTYELTMREIARHFGVRSVCDQTGKNIFFLPEITLMESPVFAVHMVRNPHKVIRSQAGKWRVRKLGVSGIPWQETLRSYLNFHPLFEALTIRKIDMLAESAQAAGHNILVLKYECLTNDTEHALEQVGAFVGVDDFALEKITVWGSSHPGLDTQQKTGIVPSGTTVPPGRGFRERGGDFWCNIILKDYKKRHVYEGPKTSFIDLLCGVGWFAVIPIQFFLVVAVNLKRSPNIIAALKRRLIR